MYNLIEYSDNYQHSSATLYQYKWDEPPEADTVADLTADKLVAADLSKQKELDADPRANSTNWI